MPDDFERMWTGLAPIGRSASSGGYFRQPFTTPERELHAWFVEQCVARGLRVETDDFGNVVGWWDVGDGPAVLTGSHLDSVPDGGAFDGPLGVVSALATVDALREAGVEPDMPLGVVNFVDEEGARFGIACAGSRLITGALDADRARRLKDGDGVTMAEAQQRAGHSPADVGPDPETLARIVRDERITSVVVAGDEVIMPLLKEQFSKDVAERVIDVLKLDIRTPEREILEKTVAALRETSIVIGALIGTLFLGERFGRSRVVAAAVVAVGIALVSL